MVAQSIDLPTEADYRLVDDALTEAHDAVEELQWRLEQLLVGRTALVPDPEDPKRLVPSSIDPTLPDGKATFADVGMLASFRDTLDLRIGEFRSLATSLGTLASYLDLARREGRSAGAER